MPSQASKKKTTTSAAMWKGKKAITSELKLPSDNVCKVRRVSIAKLMASGVFPDEMSALINESVAEKSGGKKQAVKVESLSDVSVFMDAIDKVAEMVIVEPKVVRPVRLNERNEEEELDDDDRDPQVLYTDDVDLEDKIFVFQYAVGGGSDLNKFRADLSTSVGGVRDVEDVEGSPV